MSQVMSGLRSPCCKHRPATDFGALSFPPDVVLYRNLMFVFLLLCHCLRPPLRCQTQNEKQMKKKACQKECLLLTLLPRTLFFFRAGTATCTQGRFLSFGEEADAIPSESRANAGKTAWAAYPTVRRQSSNPGQCRLGTIVVFLLKRKTGSIETPALTRPIRWAPSEL